MKYKFVTDKIYDKPKLTMEFEGEYSMLTNIFMEIVLDYENKESWLNAIDDSIKGNSKNHDLGVPGFGAEVEKDKTIVYCDFTDEEVEIPTSEFKRLSEIWFNKLEEFHKIKSLD